MARDKGQHRRNVDRRLLRLMDGGRAGGRSGTGDVPGSPSDGMRDGRVAPTSGVRRDRPATGRRRKRITWLDRSGPLAVPFGIWGLAIATAIFGYLMTRPFVVKALPWLYPIRGSSE